MNSRHRRVPAAGSWLLAVGSILLATVSCQPPPAEETDAAGDVPTESPEPTNLPLKQIMQGLEADLASVAHGIWTEDHRAIAEAATRVAEHPKVTPEQMQAIQAELGNQYPAFVQQDMAVHDGSVELAGAAQAYAPVGELFGVYVRVQQGCMSCHAAFQSRVRAVLAEG